MNDYLKLRVDYTAILHALEAINRPVWERYGKQNSTTAAWAVADYKTIGFTVGRQCGATQGIHKWINAHKGKCLLISKDATLSKETLRKYLEVFDGSDMTDFYRAVPCIRNGPFYKFANDGSEAAMTDLVENVRYVILDDSVHHYTFGRSGGRAAFNQWIADTFHEDTFVILVK